MHPTDSHLQRLAERARQAELPSADMSPWFATRVLSAIRPKAALELVPGWSLPVALTVLLTGMSFVCWESFSGMNEQDLASFIVQTQLP